MGMMINRRRVAGKKEDTYIQDGLVLWFDGIWNDGFGKTSDDPTYWKEIAGTEIQIPCNENFYYDAPNKGYINKGTNKTTKEDSAIYAVCSSLQNYTIEFILKSNYTGEKELNIGGINFIVSYDNTYAYLYKESYMKTIKSVNDNVIGTIFLCYDNGSINGGKDGVSMLITNRISITPPVITNKLSLFNGYKASATSKTIYKAIRVYNRALTQDEVLHNYLIDKQRFNI